MEIWKKLSLAFGIRKEKEDLKAFPLKILDKRRASLSETINSNNEDFNADSVTSETRLIGDGFSLPLHSSAKEFHHKICEHLDTLEQRRLLLEAIRAYAKTSNIKIFLRQLQNLIQPNTDFYKVIRNIVLEQHWEIYDDQTNNQNSNGERVIQIKKGGEQSMGFAIRGGKEYGVGFYVTSVKRNSPADVAGLKPGDEICRVNNLPLQETIHDELLSIFKSKDSVTLLVKSVGVFPVKTEGRIEWKSVNENHENEDYSRDRIVSIVVGSQGFGCNIRTGIIGQEGVFVTSVIQKSLAQRVGLKIGDRVLNVNGKNFVDISHQEALKLFQSTRDIIMILTYDKVVEEHLIQLRRRKKVPEIKADEENINESKGTTNETETAYTISRPRAETSSLKVVEDENVNQRRKKMKDSQKEFKEKEKHDKAYTISQPQQDASPIKVSQTIDQDAIPIIDDVEDTENKKSYMKKNKTIEKDELNSKSILRSNDGVNISQKTGKRALFSESVDVEIIEVEKFESEEENEEDEVVLPDSSNFDYSKKFLKGREVHYVSIPKGSPMSMELIQRGNLIIVKSVDPNGAVGTHGFIQPGDWLLNAEGDDLIGKTVKEVNGILSGILKRWSKYIEFIVACPPGREPPKLPSKKDSSEPFRDASFLYSSNPTEQVLSSEDSSLEISSYSELSMDYIIPKIHKIKKEKMASQLDDKVLSNSKLKEMQKKKETATNSFGGSSESEVFPFTNADGTESKISFSNKRAVSPERKIFPTQKNHSSESEAFPFINADASVSKTSSLNKRVVSPDGKVSLNERVVSPERQIFPTQKNHSFESEDPIKKSISQESKIFKNKTRTSPESQIFPIQEMHSSDSKISPTKNADTSDQKVSQTKNGFSSEGDFYPIKKMELLSPPTYLPVSETSPFKTLKSDEKKQTGAANKKDVIANQRYSPDSKFSPLKNGSKNSPVLKRVDFSENSIGIVSPMIQKTSTDLENSKEIKDSSGAKISNIMGNSPYSPQSTYPTIKKIESPFFELAKQKSSLEKFSPQITKGDLQSMLQIKQPKDKKIFSSIMHKEYVEIGIQTENPSSEVNKHFLLKNTIFSYKKNEEDEIKNVRKNNSNVLFENALLENHQKILKETETSGIKELHQNITTLKQDTGNENNVDKSEKNIIQAKSLKTKNILFRSSGQNLLELDLRDKNTSPQIIKEEFPTAASSLQTSHSNNATFKTTGKKKSQASNNIFTSPLLLPPGTKVSSYSSSSIDFVSPSSNVNVFTPTNQSYSPHLKKSTIFQKENNFARKEDFLNDEYLKKRRIITFVEPPSSLASLETQFTAKIRDTLQKTNYKKSQELNFSSLTKYSPRFSKHDESFKLIMNNDYTNGSSKFSIDQINESFRQEKEISKKKTSSKPYEDRYQLTVIRDNEVNRAKETLPPNHPLLVPPTLPKTKDLFSSSKYSSQKTNNKKEENFKPLQKKVFSADMIRVSALSLEGFKGYQNNSSAVNDKISKSFLSNKADILSFINETDSKNDTFTKTFSVVEINKNFRKENLLDIKEPLFIDDEKKNFIKKDLGIKSDFKPYTKKDSLFLGQILSLKSNEKDFNTHNGHSMEQIKTQLFSNAVSDSQRSGFINKPFQQLNPPKFDTITRSKQNLENSTQSTNNDDSSLIKNNSSTIFESNNQIAFTLSKDVKVSKNNLFIEKLNATLQAQLSAINREKNKIPKHPTSYLQNKETEKHNSHKKENSIKDDVFRLIRSNSLPLHSKTNSKIHFSYDIPRERSQSISSSRKEIKSILQKYNKRSISKKVKFAEFVSIGLTTPPTSELSSDEEMNQLAVNADQPKEH